MRTVSLCGLGRWGSSSLLRAAATLSISRAANHPSPSSGAVIDKNTVWGLWNEGNLFSLSVTELSTFLKTECNVDVDPGAKKSALVRQVEEIMSAEQSANITVNQGDGPTAISVTDNERGLDFFDDSDVYGDWGAESASKGNSSERHDIDFMDLSPSKMGEHYEALPPRAFQLLHESVTCDVGLAAFNPSKLPGQKTNTVALAPTHVGAYEANKIRFRRGLQWCLLNLWNMNMSGELNIGAGKALYWKEVAKHNRQVQPLWTLQSHLYNTHPYIWFALSHTSTTQQAEDFATSLGMTLTQDATTSYKLNIRKGRELLDCELNSLLRCTLLNKPWDRFLMTHYLRNQMPDLRYLVRARHGVKKRIADVYLDADILRSTRDSVQSVLSPELGEVAYCCERVIRKWGVPLAVRGTDGTERSTGLTLQLVETKRTPLIVTKIGDEGARTEYELIVKLPSQAEQVDCAALADQLWDYGHKFATSIEPSMHELHAFTMPSSAAFEPVAAAARN